MRSILRDTSRYLVVALVGGTMAACATNPVTGRPQLALISESQEIQMGQQASQEVEASIGLVEDAALQAYVHGIGTALAARSERPNLPWHFRVVDDPTPNAFALPGGFIYVTRGLLSIMDSEAELASVLGHEIAHVTARHSVAMISRAQVAQIGLVLGQILLPQTQAIGGLAEGGLSLLFLSYSRDAERQADDLGFRYALAERYDVREMPDVFAALQRAGEVEGRSPLPSWLATHPGPAERIVRIQQHLDTLTVPLAGTRLGVNEFFGRIDGLTYGDDPRQGFFRGGLFLHPELQFQMEFPQGWRTQNMPQAVMAGSPRQDAMIQLTLAGGGAQVAAQRFLNQQGVQAVRTTRETIGGSPAVVSYFQAQTQQGQVRGIAGFIDFDGRTYQILSYSPAGGFAANEVAFQRTLTSFRRLTDPQALAARPNRIAAVRVPQTMSIAEFHQRFPSVIPVDEVALINQAESPAAILPAGTFAKRVIAG
jgi:predicted Zn-dependent protease